MRVHCTLREAALLFKVVLGSMRKQVWGCQIASRSDRKHGMAFLLSL